MTENETEMMLESLKLGGMARSYRETMRSQASTNMTTQEIIAHMCLAQREENRHKTFMRLKRAAKFKHQAQPEDIQWGIDRGFDKARFRALLLPGWVNRKENVMLTGASGTGKSWLACAIGNSLVRHEVTVKYKRTNLLLEEMRTAHLDGTISKLWRTMTKPQVLILDDFGVAPITDSEKEDLFELLEARTDLGSTVITAQLSPSEWYNYLSAGHLADTIMDRIIQRSHSIELKGRSRRPEVSESGKVLE